MQGLRMQEDKGFENFFTIVQNTAKKQDNVFFCDDCLGDEFTLGNLEGDCMTGWLIPLDEAERFEKIYGKRWLWRVPDIMSVCLQNFLYSRKPEV